MCKGRWHGAAVTEGLKALEMSQIPLFYDSSSTFSTT